MRVILLLLYALISLAVVPGCGKPESEFQFEPGDHISIEVLQDESFAVDPDVLLDDAVTFVELLLSRPELLDSGPILRISQAAEYDSELGSVVVMIGIVRGELNGEGLRVFFRKTEGKWEISHVGGWVS